MDGLEISGSFAEVVVADDPFGLSVPRNLSGNVGFQIDVISSFSDSGSEKSDSVFFRASPLSTISRSTCCDDNGSGAVGE